MVKLSNPPPGGSTTNDKEAGDTGEMYHVIKLGGSASGNALPREKSSDSAPAAETDSHSYSKMEPLSSLNFDVYECPVCPHKTTFKSKEILARHLAIHSKEEKCDICKQVFTSQGHLRIHMREAHDAELVISSCSELINDAMDHTYGRTSASEHDFNRQSRRKRDYSQISHGNQNQSADAVGGETAGFSTQHLANAENIKEQKFLYRQSGVVDSGSVEVKAENFRERAVGTRRGSTGYKRASDGQENTVGGNHVDFQPITSQEKVDSNGNQPDFEN